MTDNPPPTEAAARSCALLSVGGSTEPLLLSLTRLRPEIVWYFCSPASRVLAEELHRKLEWRPFADFIETEKFEEIGPCYGALREALPRLLKKWHVDPASVTVDYTGGTKTMSAALVLASVEHFQQYCYVGGTKRDKGGLGTVSEGSEIVHRQPNPWRELGVRETGRIALLWQNAAWNEAAILLEQLGGVHPRPQRCRALAGLARAIAARHRFDFNQAAGTLSRLAGTMRSIFEADPARGPIPFFDGMRSLCEACRENAGFVTSPEVLLQELIDNSLRTAALGRYDDAAGRLYRAMEMQAQIWLAEATGGAFHNGRLRPGHPVPRNLADCPVCQPGPSGQVDLSLEQLLRALAWLQHPRAQAIIAEIDEKGAKSRWRSATARRNSSILAHGVRPVGPEGLAEMQAVAVACLGFDLSREANPIPPFDLAWLEGGFVRQG